MISFRFHIVSIVAVFLALAIGIVVGSTVIDQTIVDSLRDRVEDVRGNLRDRQVENDQLSAEVDDLETFVDESAAFSLADRLAESAVVVVVDRGMAEGPVDRTIELLGDAGADVRGMLTVDDSWTLADADTRAALGEIVDLDPEEPVESLQARAASLLVTDLASSVEVVGDDTGALDQIAALDLVDFEEMDRVVVEDSSQVLFLIVSGPESDLSALPRHTTPFAEAAADGSGGVVLAEHFVEQEDGPERAASLADVIGNPDLLAQITTVDDLDLPFGPTTVVLALAAAQAGDVGHYGVGNGADTTAPLPPEPDPDPEDQ